MSRRFFRYHIPVILYCIALFVQSSFPSPSIENIPVLSWDKALHFSAYAILFLLFFYSLKNQNKSVKLSKYALEFSFLFTVLYGISDEIHQYFVPHRDGDIFDAIADTLGAFFVYIIMKIIISRKSRALKSAVIAIIASLSILAGCSGSPPPDTYDSKDEESYYGRKQILDVNLDVFVQDVESWFDMMPVVDPEKENYRFYIQVRINKLEASYIEMDRDNFFVSNFRIVFPEYTVKRKKVKIEIFKASDKSIEIKVYHDLKVKYIDRTKPLPEKVEFHMDIDYQGELLKRIKTSEVKIKKVY